MILGVGDKQSCSLNPDALRASQRFVVQARLAGLEIRLAHYDISGSIVRAGNRFPDQHTVIVRVRDHQDLTVRGNTGWRPHGGLREIDISGRKTGLPQHYIRGARIRRALTNRTAGALWNFTRRTRNKTRNVVEDQNAVLYRIGLNTIRIDDEQTVVSDCNPTDRTHPVGSGRSVILTRKRVLTDRITGPLT